MSSMQTASRKFHATAATQDPIADIEGRFGELTAIMGNEVRKADDEEEEAPAKKAKSAGGKSAKVFVGGLPWDVTEGELEDFFKDCGTIESIDQQVGGDGRSNGIAYVFFSDSSEAEKACELHDQQLGDRWLKIEKASNRTEGVYPYNSLVQQFVKEGDVAGARGVMAEMQEAGVRCDEVTYTSLMQLFVKEGDVAGARGVMAEMREAGVRCNEVTYTSLMQLFVKEGDVAGARGVMAEMREAGVRCDEVTYTSLINCYAKHRGGGMLQSAEEVIATMDAAGIWANCFTFAALLRCCWHPRNEKRAEYWFRRAVTYYEVRPNSAVADIFQKSVGKSRAEEVCSELGINLQQLLAAGKGKGKGGKGGRGRGPKGPGEGAKSSGKGAKGSGKGAKGSGKGRKGKGE
jgi:pentatricopeptide repeat protein